LFFGVLGPNLSVYLREFPRKLTSLTLASLSKPRQCTEDKDVMLGNARRGTTLVELMVCVVFLGLCSAAMLGAIGTASRSSSIAEEKLIAVTLAKNELDKARAAGNKGTLTAFNVTTNPTGTGIKYPVTVQTVSVAVAGVADLYFVRTRVSWTSDTGNEHSGKVDLETYVVTNDL
jgi:type II secretory pathway pseudopilin PulG